MPSHSTPTSPELAERIARLEARIARLEAYVEIAPEEMPPAPPTARQVRTADEFEYEVGQTWFARFGIIALAAGGGFLLTLPYADAPRSLPGILGLVTAAALFCVAHLGRKSFSLASSYLRGAAMALFYCATLRFSFFGPQPFVPPASLAAHGLIGGAVLINLGIAWRRQSPYLFALALLMAVTTLAALADAPTVLGGCLVVSVLVAFIGSRAGWRILLPFGAVLIFATYASWAMGNPLLGHPYHWTPEPAGVPLGLLLCITILGTAPLWRSSDPDEPATGTAALVNCLLGYGVFLVHTYAINTPRFAGLHAFASGVLLWLAAVLWLRHRSRIATFFYAMGAYAALAMAIIKIADVPNVFVWLSVESVMVVATAIWFQSRFIVVTNFLIYGLVVLGYMVLNDRETGVSIGFGLVALISARVLNWQRHRLELKTELMRNAYLLSAFVVFPYALHHLVSHRYTAIAWVALALVYYALNFVIRNQKYRWMGHATLVLTTVYLLVPGQEGFSAQHRVASLLVLGAVLLMVSLLFTRGRHRRRSPSEETQP